MITKSTLVLNDLELINNIGKDSWSCVSVTITATNEHISKFLDNRSPLPYERFDIIKQIKEKAKHVQTGILLIPLIPFLADSEVDLESMVKETKNSGADYILFGGGMTMRDQQALWFLKHLKENYPELIPKYEELYNFKYNPDHYNGSYTPNASYHLKKNKLLFKLCEKYNLNYRINRYIPHDYRKMNYRVAENLLNESYEQQMFGKKWNNLFWAGQNIQNLTEPINEIAERNELDKIRNVYGDIKNKIENYLIQLQ